MVKKLQKMAEKKATSASSLLDSELAQTVKASAHQIWLAGLGAFSKAQGEGGKVFDTLIKEGINLQRKTQAVAEEKLGDVAGRMTAMAGQVGNQANAQWDKLESIFEERTARALGKLGVPNSADLATLSQRLDALEQAVAALGGPAVAKPAGRRPRAGAKTAAPAMPAAAPRKAAAGKSAPRPSAPRQATARKAAPRKRAAAKSAT